MDTPLAETFLAYSRDKLTVEFWPRICTSLDLLTEEQIWWRPNESSNSIANLLLHLNGNVKQWIVSELGGEEFDRKRGAEFAAREQSTSEELRASLSETLAKANGVLHRLSADDLAKRHTIQGLDVTGLEAIYHVVEHFAMHHGQILYIAKMMQDRDLGFYAHLNESLGPPQNPQR